MYQDGSTTAEINIITGLDWLSVVNPPELADGIHESRYPKSMIDESEITYVA